MMGITVFSLSFIGLGLTPGNLFAVALVWTFVAGFVIPMIDGTIMAIMQSTVAPEMQGPVFTLMGSLLTLTSPFSLAVAGPVSDWMGLRMWYIVAGLLGAVMGISGLFIPAIMNIEEQGKGGIETLPLPPGS